MNSSFLCIKSPLLSKKLLFCEEWYTFTFLSLGWIKGTYSLEDSKCFGVLLIPYKSSLGIVNDYKYDKKK